MAGYERALHILRTARGDAHLRYGCNAGQSLTTEPKLLNVEQILITKQLAGGVAFQTELGICTAHTAAVIRNFDEGHTATAHLYTHQGSPGINAVFHQLLDHRGRTLHHLSGRHLAGQHIAHAVDFAIGLLRHILQANSTTGQQERQPCITTEKKDEL